MTDGSFFFSRKLGGRLAQFWNQEQRIIAKAVAATRRVENLATNLAFEGLQRSTRHKSGVAMRFPRINRIRWDKPAREADELSTLERLLEKEL